MISVIPYSGFDAARAAKLAALLESSIQRRFPKGLKVHVYSVDRFGCLAALTSVLKIANLTITRANVRQPRAEFQCMVTWVGREPGSGLLESCDKSTMCTTGTSFLYGNH